jgi:hypothetical protein
MKPEGNRLPTFLVIGTNKAGTTSLYDVLKGHPQVFLPYKKELHFFNSDLNYAKGVDWYIHSFFDNAAGFPARGDITPSYLYWGDKVVPRIEEVYGHEPPRMIAILRDPVERAYSRYWHQRRLAGREPLSFEDALTAEAERIQGDAHSQGRRGLFARAYFGGGLYGAQLDRYFSSFPRENFHIILFHELNREFVQTIRGVLAFLHLDTAVAIAPTRSNPAAVLRAPRLNRWLRSRSLVGRVAKAVLSDRMLSWGRKALRKPFLTPSAYPPINPATEQQLRQRYLPDIQKLEGLIGRDLSSWYPRNTGTGSGAATPASRSNRS